MMWSNEDPRTSENMNQCIVVAYRGCRGVEAFGAIVRKDYIVRLGLGYGRWLEDSANWDKAWYWTRIRWVQMKLERLHHDQSTENIAVDEVDL